MSILEFLRRLAALPHDRFHFFIESNGCIRGNAGKSRHKLCPITAIALYEQGKFYSHVYCRYAALMIGMEPGNANLIEIAISRRDQEYAHLRTQIIKALNLVDPAVS